MNKYRKTLVLISALAFPLTLSMSIPDNSAFNTWSKQEYSQNALISGINANIGFIKDKPSAAEYENSKKCFVKTYWNKEDDNYAQARK